MDIAAEAVMSGVALDCRVFSGATKRNWNSLGRLAGSVEELAAALVSIDPIP